MVPEGPYLATTASATTANGHLYICSIHSWHVCHICTGRLKDYAIECDTIAASPARAAAEFPQDGLDALPGTAAVLELKRAVFVADAVAALPYGARNDIAIHVVVGAEVEVAVDGAGDAVFR